MLLSKPDILAYFQSGKLRFDPQVSEDRVAQVSVDLRLGRKFTTFKKPGYLPASTLTNPYGNLLICGITEKAIRFGWSQAVLFSHKRSSGYTFRRTSPALLKVAAVGRESA